MDRALVEINEPMCDEFVQYLYLRVMDPAFMAECRQMERRLANGHSRAAAVKSSRRGKHRWRS